MIINGCLNVCKGAKSDFYQLSWKITEREMVVLCQSFQGKWDMFLTYFVPYENSWIS